MKRGANFLNAVALLALGLCMLIAPNAARAQYTVEPELSRDWQVRIGLFIPNSSTARNAIGEVGISGMVERRVYDGGTYDIFIGIGYNGFDRAYSVPVMANIIGHRGNFRYGGGAGYAFNKRLDGRGSNGSVLSLILGYQLTHGKTPLTLDLRYFFTSGNNQELDGYSLTLGIRF